MARVVPQRNAPPYLLIVVVFLFLIATTLAVLEYMSADKARKQLEENRVTLNKLANDTDLAAPGVQKIMGEGEGVTVVGQLIKDVNRLSSQIADTKSDDFSANFANADALADQLRKQAGATQGLGIFARQLIDQAAALQQQIKALQDQIAERNKEIENKNKGGEEAAQQYEKKVQDLNAQLAAAEKKFADYQQSQADQMAGARQEWGQTRTELDRNIARLTKSVEELQAQNQQKQGLIDSLREEIRRASEGGKEGKKSMVRASGAVFRVIENEKMCYINLGSKDRVNPGLTFTVYSPERGLSENGEGKGTIEVRSVSDSVSLCKIISQKKDDPIVEGDLIANIAYDPTRQYTFVVEGQFDLQGTGKTSAAGAEEVKNLIKRYNGKISPEVSIETDYVVMGEEPPKPPKPSESAPPQVWEIYRDQLKTYDQYQQVKTQATNLHVPILNTNRFLSLVGYRPVK
jgi:NAD-dependent DNA ligase